MEIIHKEKVQAACKCRACVNHKKPQIHSIYKDRLVYFCNEDCKIEFDEDPEKFIADESHFKMNFEDLDTVESRLKENVIQ